MTIAKTSSVMMLISDVEGAASDLARSSVASDGARRTRRLLPGSWRRVPLPASACPACASVLPRLPAADTWTGRAKMCSLAAILQVTYPFGIRANWGKS